MLQRDEMNGDPLFDRSPDEVTGLLQTGAPVYLPVNPQEYHGPHLPLHNDGLIAAGLIRDMHERLAHTHPRWPLLVLSDLRVGTGLVPGPGSRSTPYRLLRRLVLETCRSLVELGAKRVVLMTFHGDPLHNLAIQHGLRLLTARGIQAFAPNQILLRTMLHLDPDDFIEVLATIEDPGEREAMRQVLTQDLHAGFAETSLTLHYEPSAVSPVYRKLPPCPAVDSVPAVALLSRLAGRLGRADLAEELGYISRGMRWFSLRPFPGYTGRPHLANAEAGALIAHHLADLYASKAEEVFAGKRRADRPVMGWLAALTAGGRLKGW